MATSHTSACANTNGITGTPLLMNASTDFSAFILRKFVMPMIAKYASSTRP